MAFRLFVGRRPGPTAALANLAIWGLWLWLFRSVLAHLGKIYARQDMSVSLVALIGILGLLAWRARGRRPSFADWARAPRPRPAPALLALGAALAYLGVARFLDIHILEDALFALGSYGLAGLWVAPSAWRRGWPVLLLLVATLPFGYHLDTFVGYPLRVWTAGAAATILGGRVPAGGGAEAILLLENQVAAVDLACSGVKGLWTGSLLLLAAAWLSGAGLGWRLVLAAAVQNLLLILTNLLRVTVLAGVGLGLGQPVVAGWLHLPLGVLGFAAAALVGLRVLRGAATPSAAEVASKDGVRWQSLFGRRTGGESSPERAAPITRGMEFPGSSIGMSLRDGQAAAAGGREAQRPVATGAVFTGAVLLALLLLNLAYRPRPPLLARAAARGTGSASPWVWPAGLAVEALPLKPSDAAWLAADGADAVERVRFRHGELRGSLILVRAGTWRAHHAPERCFEVYGLKQLDSSPVVLEGGGGLRQVTLGGADGRPSHGALYWFQSASGRMTGDYAARIWADLPPHREPWVLASVLFDGPVNAEGPATRELVNALRRAIDAGWKGSTP
ncbi:MAG: archaeosortase/exosortase family protein [Ardenticatenia bacterium]|nr:archaeosortase/exosortase family protein [Ardenticatenia bacterium]